LKTASRRRSLEFVKNAIKNLSAGHKTTLTAYLEKLEKALAANNKSNFAFAYQQAYA